MWHGRHPLLCPVPEETCGCWESLCWSVVPKDGGSRAARQHRDGSVVASVPGWLGQPYRGAFAAVVLAQPALPLLEERSTLCLSVRMRWHPKSLQRGSSSRSSAIPPRVVLSPRSGGSISALWVLAAFPVPSNCF